VSLLDAETRCRDEEEHGDGERLERAGGRLRGAPVFEGSLIDLVPVSFELSSSGDEEQEGDSRLFDRNHNTATLPGDWLDC
jgi:hypothetical protein